LEQLHPLPSQAVFELNKAGRVAAWPRQAVDVAVTDGIDALGHDDGYGAGNLLQDERGRADTSEDNFRTQRNQFCCIFAQAREIPGTTAIIDSQIAPGSTA